MKWDGAYIAEVSFNMLLFLEDMFLPFVEDCSYSAGDCRTVDGALFCDSLIVFFTVFVATENSF